MHLRRSQRLPRFRLRRAQTYMAGGRNLRRLQVDGARSSALACAADAHRPSRTLRFLAPPMPAEAPDVTPEITLRGASIALQSTPPSGLRQVRPLRSQTPLAARAPLVLRRIARGCPGTPLLTKRRQSPHPAPPRFAATPLQRRQTGRFYASAFFLTWPFLGARGSLGDIARATLSSR